MTESILCTSSYNNLGTIKLIKCEDKFMVIYVYGEINNIFSPGLADTRKKTK